MKDVKTAKDVEFEEVNETTEEIEKVGFFAKVGAGIKKNAKKVAIGAAIGTIGLIVGYGVGKNSSEDDSEEYENLPEEDDYAVYHNDTTEE